MYVEFVGLLQVRHHFLGSRWSPHSQGDLAPSHPTRQPQIRNSYDVIGMQVRQEQCADVCERHFTLLDALRGAATAIKYQLLVPTFYQNARPKAVHSWLRRTCSQQSDLQILRCSETGKRNAA